MLIVYTGNGKGKSTAAAGLAVRAIGNGKKVCFFQLFKGKNFYGEQKLLTKIKKLKFYSFAHKHPFCFKQMKLERVRAQCVEALKELKRVLSNNNFDIVIMDEFIIAIRDKFLKLDEILNIILPYNSSIDFVLTGRGAPKKLIASAGLVTEMKEVKHPYNNGVKAKAGIEF